MVEDHWQHETCCYENITGGQYFNLVNFQGVKSKFDQSKNSWSFVDLKFACCLMCFVSYGLEPSRGISDSGELGAVGKNRKSWPHTASGKSWIDWLVVIELLEPLTSIVSSVLLVTQSLTFKGSPSLYGLDNGVTCGRAKL